mgnify:FL=1|tara:strand:+ start:2592 stop:3920 length:1329 start_codon:yes stop_codon:yes gene_type:complete
MKNHIEISNEIKSFDKKINVEGDKSLSIRFLLLAAQAQGISNAKNLLNSEDVNSSINCLKLMGIKISKTKTKIFVKGNGLGGFQFKKGIILNAGNSGTLARLILSLLVKSPYKIKLIGDKSLSKRDFSRVIKPLEKFGVSFFPKNKKTLPLYIKGAKDLKPIVFSENKGSAQIKSCVMLAALSTSGRTIIKAKKSRDHTENLFKFLKINTKIKKTKNLDHIEISGNNNYKPFNYNVPGDISSSAFFIVLTTLSKNSKILIKNVNINPSRTGVVKILNRMGAKIIFKNIKEYKGEKIANIYVESSNSLKGINCPIKFNSSAIDEFLIIFLVAAKSKGTSYFKDLSELNKKESPRLEIASKILSMIGIKNKSTNHSIKIYGNPNLKLSKNYEIKNFLKDHRIFMMSTIAALTLGGKWKIYDSDSINTSFPSFLKIIKKLGGHIN